MHTRTAILLIFSCFVLYVTAAKANQKEKQRSPPLSVVIYSDEVGEPWDPYNLPNQLIPIHIGNVLNFAESLRSQLGYKVTIVGRTNKPAQTWRGFG